ncbi:uncharacterized protein CcaverHIS019_0102470 [Cutaneotrichosporon cavernicola]|uniref:Uncharacterized protein n=1 Tax=Cutaneotrichosporon cavernicola TaxID=279322 RepID=A0AA48KWU3_9TREE|nr:uncharacterized protein CcaverHIS019_0102470 [Cutaneotrichosporon cavernicola]BEI87529.1 hypothetical protein CcaverHIS019_0102470 [Cutaneotrichosporon cavernicola]BEI95300.1 hypothetical protein CcaverHIS631_0102490 [Cutaneotrichosporon cavernicola]BEJ03074.1 hypothetical protein CcaverHIS641_0102490 [Cutaneotrichosporon cavernicola]
MPLSRLRAALGACPPRTVTPMSTPVGSLAHRAQARRPNPFLDTPTPTPTRSTSRLLPRVALVRPRLPIFPPTATASPSPSPVSILAARLSPALRYKPLKVSKTSWTSKACPTSTPSVSPSTITPGHTPSTTITSEPATAEFAYTPSAAPYLAETWRRRVFPSHTSTSHPPTPKLTFFPPYSPPRSSLIGRLAAFSGFFAVSGPSESSRQVESGTVKKSWWARWIAPDHAFETVSEIRDASDDWQTAYNEAESECVPFPPIARSPMHTPRASHRRYHSAPIDIHQLASPYTPFRFSPTITPPVLHMFDQSQFSSVRFRHLTRGTRPPASPSRPRYLNPHESRNLLDIVRELCEAITLRFWAVLRPQMEPLRHHRHCCPPVAGRLRWAYA